MFRWVEDKKVSDRIIEIWPSIVKIVNHWPKLAPSKQPKCKSYEVLKGVVKDPLVVAKLNFFSFLAGHLLPYLTSYQSQKPMIPFLHSDLQQLVKKLLGLAIKSELIDKCKENSKSLLKIDLRDVNNHIKKKDMHLCFGTLDEIQSLLRNDLASQANISRFRVEAREFLVAMMEKIFQKNPLPFQFVQYVTVFDPKFLLNQASGDCKSLFGKLMRVLVGLKIVPSTQADKALSEFTSFHESCMSEKRSDFEKFKRHKDRLDDFFMKTEIGSCKNLFSILKLVLVLSRGQANVERCFSVNNVLKFNMSENSIVSRKLIIDHMKCHNLSPQSFPITNDLLKSVCSSRQRYAQYLRGMQQCKRQNEKTDQLKIIDKEIYELKGAISDNKRISENLNAQFLQLTDEAEKQKDLLKTKELFSKGNGLKRKSCEKLEENKQKH